MTSESPACLHRVLDDGIREFIFIEPSRRAVDEMFAILDVVQIESLNNNLPIPLNPTLVDISIGLPPLNYAFKRMQSNMSKNSTIRGVSVALIAPSSPLLQTISMVMRPLGSIRLYKPDERDKALVWLRASQTQR